MEDPQVEGPVLPDQSEEDDEGDEEQGSDQDEEQDEHVNAVKLDVDEDLGEDESNADEDEAWLEHFPSNPEEDPELMRELEGLEQDLIDAEKRPPPSREEKA